MLTCIMSKYDMASDMYSQYSHVMLFSVIYIYLDDLDDFIRILHVFLNLPRSCLRFPPLFPTLSQAEVVAGKPRPSTGEP